MKMINTDRAKAADQLLGMSKGDQIVYSAGTSIGPLGNAMFRLSEKGLFCLTQKAERPSRGPNDARSYHYIATRTGQEITKGEVMLALSVGAVR